MVSILVVAAVVIDDAGRHRAAGRVVIGEVARPLSSYFFYEQSRPAAFVKRAGVRVVIDDAGRHRAAGRVVISEAPDTNHRPPW